MNQRIAMFVVPLLALLVAGFIAIETKPPRLGERSPVGRWMLDLGATQASLDQLIAPPGSRENREWAEARFLIGLIPPQFSGLQLELLPDGAARYDLAGPNRGSTMRWTHAADGRIALLSAKGTAEVFAELSPTDDCLRLVDPKDVALGSLAPRLVFRRAT